MVEALSAVSDGALLTGEDELEERVRCSLKHDGVAVKLFEKLRDLDLTRFEGQLGTGAFGCVVQLRGCGEFSGKNLALKLFAYSQLNAISSNEVRGEVLSLGFPAHSHLGRSYGVFTYDGKDVHFVEKFKPEVHTGQVVISTLSRAIAGGTFYERMQKGPLTLDEIKGFGKQIAESILALHRSGCAHKDIHAENILIKAQVPGKSPYRIKIIDFNIAGEVNGKRIRTDWRKFGYILAEMGSDKLLQDPYFFDLVYSELHGLLNGEKPYSKAQVVNHPFFRESGNL